MAGRRPQRRWRHRPHQMPLVLSLLCLLFPHKAAFSTSRTIEPVSSSVDVQLDQKQYQSEQGQQYDLLSKTRRKRRRLTNDRHGALTISECPQSNAKNIADIQIQGIALVCDSAYAYYGGEGTHSNSIACEEGDIAKVVIDFQIRSTKWDMPVDINATIEASFYGITSIIYDKQDICSFGNLQWSSYSVSRTGTSSNYSYKSNDDDDDNQEGDADDEMKNNNNGQQYQNSCPLSKGSYQLMTSFRVPQFTRDPDITFTPDLVVTFIDGAYFPQPRYYTDRNGNRVVSSSPPPLSSYLILTCASTGALAALRNGRQRNSRGIVIFGLSVVLFFVTFGCCLLCAGRRRKRKGGRSNTASSADLLGYNGSAGLTSDASFPTMNYSAAALLRRYEYRREKQRRSPMNAASTGNKISPSQPRPMASPADSATPMGTRQPYSLQLSADGRNPKSLSTAVNDAAGAIDMRRGIPKYQYSFESESETSTSTNLSTFTNNPTAPIYTQVDEQDKTVRTSSTLPSYNTPKLVTTDQLLSHVPSYHHSTSS